MQKTRLQRVKVKPNYRREIANGIVDQIKSLQNVGMNIEDVNNVVLFNQYLDVMRSYLSQLMPRQLYYQPQRQADTKIYSLR